MERQRPGPCGSPLMPISLTCTGCGKRLKAKDSLAGRTVPCPHCGVKLVIGSAEDVAASMLLDEAASPEPDYPATTSRETVAATTRSAEPSPSMPAPRAD